LRTQYQHSVIAKAGLLVGRLSSARRGQIVDLLAGFLSSHALAM
jgi:hypothetical protein